MDIVAHGLWAAVGATAVARRLSISRSALAGTIFLAVVPDLVHVAPVAIWALFGSGSVNDLAAYIMLTGAAQPVLPATVTLWSHHLHCTMHSAIVAAVVSAVSVAVSRSLWFPLWGWWSHIVIDVFTHSADFYPSPVFYPLTLRGFDGIAWNTPWFATLNYACLIVAFAWLRIGRSRSSRPPSGSSPPASSVGKSSR